MQPLIDWYKKKDLWLKILLALPVGALIILGLFAFRAKPSPGADTILRDDKGAIADSDKRQGQLAPRVADVERERESLEERTRRSLQGTTGKP